jgi:hypothetical protein
MFQLAWLEHRLGLLKVMKSEFWKEQRLAMKLEM